LSLQEEAIREDLLHLPAPEIVADTNLSRFRLTWILDPGRGQGGCDDDRIEIHSVERRGVFRLRDLIGRELG
jgi:hypothetical protein